MKLSNRKAVLIGIVALALSASTAFAAPGHVRHPRRAEVNGRLYDQNRRIAAGVKDGELSRAEAHQLRGDDRGIYAEERQMAKLDGGHISRADQRALNQQENVVSKDIHTERHD